MVVLGQLEVTWEARTRRVPCNGHTGKRWKLVVGLCSVEGSVGVS